MGPVYIYKDCREAFKIYTTEWSFKLTESIEGLKKLAKVSAGQEFGNKAVKLAQEFDQINVAMQNEYVAACSLFNTGPCDPDVRERYYKEIESYPRADYAIKNGLCKGSGSDENTNSG